MKKYFKEDIFEEKKISEYYQELSDHDRKVLKYLIETLGDVELDRKTFNIFIEQFHCFGGRYNVRTRKETIKGVYGFVKDIPTLSSEAIDEIFFRYIEDIFEECKMKTVLKKYIELFGKTDDAFEQFILYLETKADEYAKKYKEDASKLDQYYDQYYMEDFADWYQYISYLKSIVVREHISADAIIDCLPSPELVKKDARHLSKLSYTYRSDFGVDYPASYKITKCLAKGEDLTIFGERPSYYISIIDSYEDATFTTKEFIDSIKKEEDKRLIRKK